MDRKDGNSGISRPRARAADTKKLTCNKGENMLVIPTNTVELHETIRPSISLEAVVQQAAAAPVAPGGSPKATLRKFMAQQPAPAIQIEATDSQSKNPYGIYQREAIQSAETLPWSPARHQDLLKAAALHASLIEGVQELTYPVSEADLQKIFGTSSTIPFFAYSSMIDKDAGAVKAISAEGAHTREPAIAFGIQRTFNREMAAATVEGGWGPLQRPNDLAILNVFRKEDAILNGVLFELPLSDMLILSKREVGYKLIPVLITRWNDALDRREPEVILAYTFQAPDYAGEEIRYTNDHVNPIPGYFHFLQKGLNVMGDDFKTMWWSTTYLADQNTQVNELPFGSIDLK
jgi:hypothetical protein